MNLTRSGILRSPERLPRGFFKPRGVFGGFFYVGFLALLALTRRGVFLKPSKVRQFLKMAKKGLETHCLRGLYVHKFKTAKIETPGTCWGVPLTVPVLNPGNRVIGNRHAENTPKSAASLVTGCQNTGVKACRHW